MSPASLPAAGHDDVERGLLDLLERRVDDPLAVDQPDAHRADGAVERQAGEARRARTAAFIAGMSYGLAMSTPSTVMTTWTSSR